MERTFPDGWVIQAGREGSQRCLAVVERNADEDVTWVHSYVSDDTDVVREAARRAALPFERVAEALTESKGEER